jgi:hypothetical protein
MGATPTRFLNTTLRQENGEKSAEGMETIGEKVFEGLQSLAALTKQMCSMRLRARVQRLRGMQGEYKHPNRALCPWPEKYQFRFRKH